MRSGNSTEIGQYEYVQGCTAISLVILSRSSRVLWKPWTHMSGTVWTGSSGSTGLPVLSRKTGGHGGCTRSMQCQRTWEEGSMPGPGSTSRRTGRCGFMPGSGFTLVARRVLYGTSKPFWTPLHIHVWESARSNHRAVEDIHVGVQCCTLLYYMYVSYVAYIFNGSEVVYKTIYIIILLGLRLRPRLQCSPIGRVRTYSVANIVFSTIS